MPSWGGTSVRLATDQIGQFLGSQVVAHARIAFPLGIDWHIELRSATQAFNWFEFVLRRQRRERLLLAGQVADWARKGLVRLQSVPPINEAVDVMRRRADRLEMIKQHVK